MLSLIRKFAQWPWPLLRAAEENVSDVWAQFRQGAGVLENEVTEINLTLGSTAALVNGKLHTPTAGTSTFDFFTSVNLNSDFTIESKFNFSGLGSGKAGQILGQWVAYGTTVDVNNSWQLYAYDTGQLAFIASKTGQGSMPAGSYIDLRTPTGVWSLNKDHHVAVTRRGTVLTLWVDGISRATLTVSASDSFVVASKSVSNYWTTSATSFFLLGYRWDMRISRESLYNEPYTPASISPYRRAVYSQTLAEKICAQYGFRRNSLADEAGSGQVSLFGTASVANGRISVTNALTSYYTAPYKKFGAGDFTIELMLNLTTVNTTYGANVFGQWRAGGVADDNNRWTVFVGANRNVTFSLARSAAANDYEAIGTANGKIVFGRDYHVVVERVNGIVTIYLNGVAEASGSLPMPVRGASNFVARCLSDQNAYTMAGQVWNMRIVDKAVYGGTIKIKPTYPGFVSPFVWPTRQFTFLNNAIEDEVTGHQINLSSTNPAAVNVENGRLFTGTSYLHKAEFPTFWCGANEDFTIELNFNAKAVGSTGGALLCVWTSAELAGNSWWLGINANRTLSFAIATANTGNANVQATSTATIALNTDNHIAAVRVGSTVTVYLNGVAVASMQYAGALIKQSSPTSTSWNSSTGVMNGQRWNIRLVRGEAKYKGPFAPIALAPFYRPLYTEAEQSGILHQLTFRENLNLDEIKGTSPAVTLTSNTSIVRGRMTTTSSATSYYSMPVDYFGAGDFTMECHFNVTNIATNHVDLMTHWYNGANTNSNNRYLVRVMADLTLQVIFSNSGTANDYTSRLSTLKVELNKDFHLVVERVDGVITVYVDGAVFLSWTQAAPLWATTGNLIEGRSQNVAGYGARAVWNIRIASKALYRGLIPARTSFSQTTKSSSMFASNYEAQVLVKATPNKILSDQSVQVDVQVLTKTEPKKILPDQSTQTIIQVLVKK